MLPAMMMAAKPAMTTATPISTERCRGPAASWELSLIDQTSPIGAPRGAWAALATGHRWAGPDADPAGGQHSEQVRNRNFPFGILYSSHSGLRISRSRVVVNPGRHLFIPSSVAGPWASSGPT